MFALPIALALCAAAPAATVPEAPPPIRQRSQGSPRELPTPASTVPAVPVDRATVRGSLGTPLRQDGYTFRPPEGFRMVRMEPFLGTRAGAVSDRATAHRFLSAALVDGDDPSASALLVSVVEGTFMADPAAKDAFSTQVVRHFNDELGLPLALERAVRVMGASPRVEVLGTLKQQDQIRGVLVAAMEGEGRHAVVTFTVPFARFEKSLPHLRASLDSFRADNPPISPWTRRLAGAVLPALGLMLMGSWLLWRRRQTRRGSANV